MMDLILEGDLDLIEFAYDIGIGEKNSMGFGMVKLLVNKNKKRVKRRFLLTDCNFISNLITVPY